jgi:hypothetical protein
MTQRPSTLSTVPVSIALSERSLYGLLDQPAPAGAFVGETRITATKETVDDDVEALNEEGLDA